VVTNEPTTLVIPIIGMPLTFLMILQALITSAVSPDWVKQITPTLFFGKSNLLKSDASMHMQVLNTSKMLNKCFPYKAAL
jgi:hypothetical protein